MFNCIEWCVVLKIFIYGLSTGIVGLILVSGIMFIIDKMEYKK